MSKLTQLFDKRICFVKEALNRGITHNPSIANAWYISTDGKKLPNEEALKKFSEYCHAPAS